MTIPWHFRQSDNQNNQYYYIDYLHLYAHYIAVNVHSTTGCNHHKIKNNNMKCRYAYLIQIRYAPCQTWLSQSAKVLSCRLYRIPLLKPVLLLGPRLEYLSRGTPHMLCHLCRCRCQGTFLSLMPLDLYRMDRQCLKCKKQSGTLGLIVKKSVNLDISQIIILLHENVQAVFGN